MGIAGFKELQVWQKSMDLLDGVYELTRTFPKEEVYTLTSQIRRSAISIPSNIAEGSSKRSTKEFIRFINIAYGSLSELETQLIIAERQGYCHSVDEFSGRIAEIGRMLNGLRNALCVKSNNTELRTLDSECL